MNANTQFDLHPDAESLNAFAEQALAEQERGKIVAHLAGCSRCRQIVFLAQEAAVEMEPAVEVAAVRPALRRGSWLRNWWFVWAPTAALAATVAVAVYVHVRRVEIESEMAKVTTEAARRIGESHAGPAAAATEKKDESGTAMPAGPEPAQPASQKRKAMPPSPVAPTIAASAPGTFAGESYGMRSSSGDEARSRAGAAGAGNPEPSALAEAKPEPAESAMRENQVQTFSVPESRAMDRTMAAKKSAQAKTDEPEKSEQRVELQAAAAAPEVQTEAGPAPQPIPPVSAVHGLSGAFAVYKARPSELPSLLPAVSSVAALNRMLAVDPAGSVFLSEDAGIHWKSVEKQWKGRAITARIQEAPSANGGVARSTPTAFEIVNDRGDVWVSTDGRNWKAK